MALHHPPDKATKCNARKVEITPPHSYTPLTGKEPGVEAVLVEWNSPASTNLWPPRSDKSTFRAGFTITNKQAALDLARKIEDAANSMSD